MSDPYIGEIRMFGGNFAPAGWAFCDGQLMPISENDALFTLIGTTYGGDGQETFGIPNLQSRAPIHQGTNPTSGTTFIVGETGGVENVTLTTQQIPQHNHALLCSGNNVTSPQPANNVAGVQPIVGVSNYGTDAPRTTLAPTTISPLGGSQPHENMQPFVCVSFIISLFGIFPSQT